MMTLPPSSLPVPSPPSLALGATRSGEEVLICKEHDIAYARHRASLMAEALGLSRPQRYRLITAVSELGYNLMLHTTNGGVMRLIPLTRTDPGGVTATGERVGVGVGVEVVAEDKGPGIPDIALAMRDGYSTNHGLGSGLPGCRRLMDEFWIWSRPGEGTRVVARLWR